MSDIILPIGAIDAAFLHVLGPGNYRDETKAVTASMMHRIDKAYPRTRVYEHKRFSGVPEDVLFTWLLEVMRAMCARKGVEALADWDAFSPSLQTEDNRERLLGELRYQIHAH